MADFTGTDVRSPLLASPAGRSTDVTNGSFAGARTVSLTSASIATSQGTPQPAVAIANWAETGALQELFGGQLFERVIVTPRSKGFGFILSATQFPVEVWNTFRNTIEILTAIAITGVGGVEIDDVYGEPLAFAALDSRVYQVTTPQAGAVAIAQDLVFEFTGLTGTDVVISGSRITLFSVAPEWGNGIKETISFLTNVLVAYSDNEQRRGLRQIARRGLKYRALALTARNAAGMESLVWGWQNQPYGVPWWPDSSALTSDIAEGSFVVPCDTTDRLFAVDGLAVIWVDEFTFEALTITAVNADSIEVASPTQFAWTANAATQVLPVFLCRLANKVEVDRLFSGADQIDLEFAGEAQQPAPAPVATLTQYKGFDVLEAMPNWATDLKREYGRSIVTLDPKIGPISVVDRGGSAVVAQDFPWYLESHAAVTKFRAFLLARFGQLNPFWIPTFDQDLVLANDVGGTDSSIRIQSEFYTRFFFPSKARQYVAFIPEDGSGNVYRKITAAIDNLDGTETLTLDLGTGKAFVKYATMISFLTFARLASDDAEIEWMNADLAETTLPILEVPREVP